MLPAYIEFKLKNVPRQIIAKGKNSLIPDKEKFAYELYVSNFPGEEKYAAEILHEILERMDALRKSRQIKRIESKHPNGQYTLQEALQEIIDDSGTQILDNPAVCRQALQFFVLYRNFSPETVEFFVTLLSRGAVSKITTRAQRTPIYDKRRFAAAFYAEYHKSEESEQKIIKMIVLLLDVLENSGKIKVGKKPAGPSSLKDVLLVLVRTCGYTVLTDTIFCDSELTHYRNYYNEIDVKEKDYACLECLLDKQVPAKILHAANTTTNKDRIAFLAYQAVSTNQEIRDERIFETIVLLIDVLADANCIKRIKIEPENLIHTLPTSFERIVEAQGIDIFDDEKALAAEMQYYLFYQRVSPLDAELLDQVAEKLSKKFSLTTASRFLTTPRNFGVCSRIIPVTVILLNLWYFRRSLMRGLQKKHGGSFAA